MSTISISKDKHSDIEAYYQNESKTFWFGPLNIGTKATHFDLVQNFFFIASRTFPFWPKNAGTKQSNLIWSGNCLRQSRTFLISPKTNRSKQNVLILFAYYRNECKTFRFGNKKVFLQADPFHFCSKILGQNKAVWFGLEVVLGKLECLYLIQKLKDQSKTFWFGHLNIGTKSKRFDLVWLGPRLGESGSRRLSDSPSFLLNIQKPTLQVIDSSTRRVGESLTYWFGPTQSPTRRAGELATPGLGESGSRHGESGSRYSNFFKFSIDFPNFKRLNQPFTRSIWQKRSQGLKKLYL